MMKEELREALTIFPAVCYASAPVVLNVGK